MARNATFRGANLQYIAATKQLNNLNDVSIASSTDKDLLQYSSSSGKWTDVAAIKSLQIEDTSSNHQYVFAVSELAADRTVTLPLLTGDDTLIFAAFAATLTNKTLTSPVINTGVSGSAILDQDDMSGNSATQLATQQSIKAYVDAQVATEDTLAELNDTTISGPASNDVLQYSGSAWVDRTYAEAGLASLTGSETLTNKTLTSPVLNGGALTALTDLDMTSGDKTILDTIGANTLTIGASGTTVTIPGNLTVTGTTTTVSSTNTVISDKLITLNDGGSASSGTAVGIEVEEDSSATAYWKTAADRAGWELKAPGTAGVLSIDPSGNSNTITFGGSSKVFTISETATIDQDLSTTANVTHANLTATGNVTLGNAASDTVTITGVIAGATPLVFEGNTGNAYETTLAITDPTADRTWTLPDATDTFVGLATSDSLSNKTLASPVITTGDINTPDIDGGTVDAITSLTVANNVDVGSYTVRASGFLADGLTAGQVVYTGTDGVLSSEAALAYNATSNTLTATNIAGTLTTAAQTAITSVGALSGGSIASGFGAIDNGSSAITTTGTVTGGTLAGTLSTAAQGSVTSLGTLTALTVDNIAINGTTIGHTGDTDLITLAADTVTIDGNLGFTGPQTISTSSGALTLDAHSNTFTLGNNEDSGLTFEFLANRTSASSGLVNIDGKWNNTLVARIAMYTGGDNTNKDDAHIVFQTASAGSVADAFAIRNDKVLRAYGTLSFRQASTIETTAGALTVQPAANLILDPDDDIILSPSGITQNYAISDRGHGLTLQSAASNTGFRLEMFTADGNNEDALALIMYAKGTPSAMDHLERGLWYWDETNEHFFFGTDNSGASSTARDLRIGVPAGKDIILGDDEAILTVDGGTGGVGIGATPNETLHVLTSGSSTYTAAAKRGLLITDANGPRIGWEDTGEGSNDKIMSVAYESENLVFGSMLDDGSNYDVNNILVLNRDGNVGIGAASTGAKFYVNGTVTVTGNIDLSNTGDLVNVGDSANSWTTGKLTVGNGHVENTATGSPRGLRLINSSTALAEGSMSNNDCWMYVKDDKIVFAYKDATTSLEYYLYADMGSGGGTTWTHTQTAP